MTDPRTYTAFISYSHTDKKRARKLHRALESYRIPKHIRQAHRLPKRLSPIFCDYAELPAGGDLPDGLQDGLLASKNLIVLGSTAARSSYWVGKEIAMFKSFARGRIVPAIIAGDGVLPFPETLTQVIGADGNATSETEPMDLLVADVRPQPEGGLIPRRAIPRDGLLAVVAGLLGVSIGELTQRELEAIRRERIALVGLSVLFALIATLAVVNYVREGQQRKRAEGYLAEAMRGVSKVVEQMELRAHRGEIATEAAAILLASAERTVQRIGADVDDPRVKQLKVRLEGQVAQSRARIGDSSQAIDAATAAVTSARELAKQEGDVSSRANLAKALVDQADVQCDAAPNQSEREYAEALEIRKQLAAAAPEDGASEFAVGLTLARIAGMEEKRENLHAARERYATAFKSYSALAGRFPEELNYRRSAWAIVMKVAALDRKLGNAAAALSTYKEWLPIIRDLAERDPSNLQLKCDLGQHYIDLGSVLGDQAQSEAYYTQSRDIFQSLLKKDPNELDYQDHLASSYEYLGFSRVAKNDLPHAISFFNDAISTSRRLVNRDPQNLQFRANLAERLIAGANTMNTSQRDPKTDAMYLEAFSQMLDVSSAAPSNLSFKNLLISGYVCAASVHIQSGSTRAVALSEYKLALDLADELNAAAPDNFDYKVRALETYTVVADIAARAADIALALTATENAIRQARALSLQREDHEYQVMEANLLAHRSRLNLDIAQIKAAQTDLAAASNLATTLRRRDGVSRDALDALDEKIKSVEREITHARTLNLR